ncbi:5-methylcytosine-specific restriction protein A [Kribbella kalugense]|uniref:5-methylcytosine-specific restriction protein A n=1 Tax=Kribbella kalugense TaxID=2512221 RepID=A0A4R7ZIE8_9ACTN|nr:5-methylcytosine-specific restriction protein A [Kribbella kalugense]
MWSLSGGELLSELDALDAELAQRESRRLQVVARIEESGYAEELGARDAVELLSFRYRRDRAEAWRDVRLARALPKYTTVADGLTHGIPVAAEDSTDDVGGVRVMRTAQAGVIVSALERVRSRVPVEDLDVAEQQLVTLAGRLSPAELRTAAKQICDLLDSDGPEPDENKAYERESLTLSNAENGVKFRGYLANENAELLRSLTFSGARPHKTPTGDLDPRPRDKRQADALTTALTIAAAATDAAFTPPTARPPRAVDPADTAGTAAGVDMTAPVGENRAGWVPGFGAKANITVTIDLNDLKAATADATGNLVYGDQLSAAAIRRLACDAKIIPLVLGSNSQPLDVGRAERLVTRAMRRALNARDRGCVVCGAPPVMCDAHHLTSWIDGGPTAISNLALVCRRHHTDLHNGHWTITTTNGQVHVTRPTWADPPPQPRPTPSTHLQATPAPRPNTRATTDPDPQSPRSSPRPSPRSCPDSGRPSSRWSADEPAMQEAARFAVWGESADLRSTPVGDPSTNPPSTTPQDPVVSASVRVGPG